jgi:hypothetical protein
VQQTPPPSNLKNEKGQLVAKTDGAKGQLPSQPPMNNNILTSEKDVSSSIKQHSVNSKQVN